MSTKRNYQVAKGLPVLRCYYQGGHSHPVQRVGLVIESNRTHVKVYELREGKTIRTFANAPVKTYRRDRIAKIGQCGRRLRKRTPAALHGRTTLQRLPLLDLIRSA